MMMKIFCGCLVLLVMTIKANAQKPAQTSPTDTLAGWHLPVPNGFYALPLKKLSGAAARVAGSLIQMQQVPSFKDALQGQVAGVQVIQSNGMPTSEAVVRIRGTVSIFAETEPLYVIDGIPVYTGPRDLPGAGPGAGWGSVYGPLNDMNPNDIESITVLKDAAGTALYGARGAAGVIVINTRKGIKGKQTINFNYREGITSATHKLSVLNGPQYLSLLDQAWINSGQTGPAPFPAASGLNLATARTTSTDNLAQILGTGAIRQMDFSTSYGSDVTTFYFSGSYSNEQGILTGNNITRYTGNLSVTNQITRKLSLGASVRLNFSNSFNMPVGYAPGGGFNAAQSNLPVYPLYKPNGLYFYESDPNTYNLPGSNVASFMDKNEFDNSEHSKRIFLSSFLNYQLLPGLDFKTEGAWDQYFQTRTDYLSKRTRNGSVGSGTGREGAPTAYAGYEKYTKNTWDLRSTLNYRRVMKDYELTAVAGFEFNHNTNPYLFAEGEGFANDFARQPATAGYRNTTTAQGLTTNISSLVGYFANGNLSYKGRYQAGATLRYDGSSRFGALHKYAMYPAVSVGWILSEESFFDQQQYGFSYLKLRASYGRAGNMGIGNYTSQEQWTLNPNSRYLLQPGLQLQSLGSPALKPESVDQLDLGIDFTLTKGWLSGTVDLYQKTTRDLLLQYNVPLSAGVANTGLLLNAGSLQNRGVELTLNSRNLSGRLSWNTSLTLAHNQNKLLDLDGLPPGQFGSHPNIVNIAGHPLGTFFLATYAGVDPASGAELIVDAQGNTVPATSAAQIDAARRPQYDKPSAPKLFGGLSNNFRYKHLELNVMMSFSLGNYILDEGERQLSYLRGNNNLRSAALNTWTAQQSSTDFPRLIYNDPIAGSNTTRFLHNASYLRAKNITLSYDLKHLLPNLKFVSGARFFITAQNCFTITGFKGWDPEISGNYFTNPDRSLNQGITYLDLPQVRTLAAGFNLKF